MSIQLLDIVKEWLLTWEPSGFTVLEPGMNDTIPPDYQGAVYYKEAPVYWGADIFEDRVLYHHHGGYELIWATDPQFFIKLKMTLEHVADALNCSVCRQEIMATFKNDD